MISVKFLAVSYLLGTVTSELFPSSWMRLWSPVAQRFRRPPYTPLVFFTVPPGLIPECDAMEKCVRKVEEALDVRVERLDVLRQPEAEAVLSLLSTKTPPLLYNRESNQVVHVPKAGRVDYSQVKAWAKGRYLPTLASLSSSASSEKNLGAPVVVSQESQAIDQDELLEDALLTPLQRKGKQAIRERTEARSTKG